MLIHRSGTLPTSWPPEATFTGDVQIGAYFQRGAPSRLSGATVTFAPGTRTPWKVNLLGQTLVVTGGRAQRRPTSNKVRPAPKKQWV